VAIDSCCTQQELEEERKIGQEAVDSCCTRQVFSAVEEVHHIRENQNFHFE
jgi:hypothetical protein